MFFTPGNLAGGGFWRPGATNANPFASLSGGAFYWTSDEDLTPRTAGAPVDSIADLLYGTGQVGSNAGSARPIYRLGGVGGSPYLECDGNDDRLNTATNLLLTGNFDFTVYTHIRPNSSASDQNIINHGNVFNTSGHIALALFSNTTLRGAFTGNDQNLTIGAYSGANLYLGWSYRASDRRCILVARGDVTASGTTTYSADLNVTSTFNSNSLFRKLSGEAYKIAVVQSSQSISEINNCLSYWEAL